MVWFGFEVFGFGNVEEIDGVAKELKTDVNCVKVAIYGI
jgi:hypothetical protein